MSRNHTGSNARAQREFRKATLLFFGYRCQYPGCGQLGGRTEVHHKIALADGGTNDLSNAMLYCREHHIEIHRPAVPPDVAAWRALVTDLLTVKPD